MATMTTPPTIEEQADALIDVEDADELYIMLVKDSMSVPSSDIIRFTAPNDDSAWPMAEAIVADMGYEIIEVYAAKKVEKPS